MLKFNEYCSLVVENFNQMKSLFSKESGKDIQEIVANGNSPEYELLKTLIGVDSKYTKVCTDQKIQATYGDNIVINEEKERSMRSYLGMFTKLFYDEKCPLSIIKDISYYILANKATLNQLVVKNNSTGETQVLSNLLDIFKFKDKVKANNDNRPAYEIITDAIRDKDKTGYVSDFINLMPGILRKEFRNNDNAYSELSDLLNTFQTINEDIKASIHKTFFGNNENPGKISRYKTTEHFLKDFGTMITNSNTDFNIDVIKNKILNTKGAILIECDYEHNYIIADIWSYKASNILGEPSSWCISYDNDNSYWFNSYMGLKYKRKMFFIWNFDLLSTNPISKLGANIDNDGSVNLVCDKNDHSVNETRFIDYLNEYNIDKSFLKKKITKAEETFRTNDKLMQDLYNEQMFASITSENIKTELPRILKMMKSEGVETPSKLLRKAIDNKIARLKTEEIYHIINKFLDTFGVSEDYSTNLFTLLLTLLVQEKCIIPNEIYKLYKRLGSNINYEILKNSYYTNLQNVLYNQLPKLYDIIHNYVSNAFYNDGSQSYMFFENVTLKELDDNFDKLFNNEEIVMAYKYDIMRTVFSDYGDTKTKNNFLQKLNDVGCDFIKARKDPSHKMTGFFETDYNHHLNFKCILESINGGYDITEDMKEEYKKLLLLNKNNLGFVTDESNEYFIIRNIICLYNKLGMDITEINFKYHVKQYRDVEYFRDNIINYLKCIISNKLTFEEYCHTSFYVDLLSNKYYDNNEYQEYIDEIIENKKVVLNNKKYFTIRKDDISQNTPFIKKLLTNDIFNNSLLYATVLVNNNELTNLCLPKIIETIDHNDIIKEYINTDDDDISDAVKDYLLENIDISSCAISEYTTLHNPRYIKILLDNGVEYDAEWLTRLINYGRLTKYNQDTLDIVDELIHTGFTKDRYINDTKFYLNDLNVMKYIFEKIPSSIDTLKEYKIDVNKLLSTCDLDKIKYYKSLGLISTLPNLNNLDGTYDLSLDINTINYLIDNNDVTEYADLFKICRDLETFKYFFAKYKDDMDYITIAKIVLYNLKDSYTRQIPGVLDYLKSIIPDTLQKIVMNHYDENKRRKVYSDVTREWIKNNYYTKEKVKKIREMFEIFQNLVKY